MHHQLLHTGRDSCLHNQEDGASTYNTAGRKKASLRPTYSCQSETKQSSQGEDPILWTPSFLSGLFGYHTPFHLPPLFSIKASSLPRSLDLHTARQGSRPELHSSGYS